MLQSKTFLQLFRLSQISEKKNEMLSKNIVNFISLLGHRINLIRILSIVCFRSHFTADTISIFDPQQICFWHLLRYTNHVDRIFLDIFLLVSIFLQIGLPLQILFRPLPQPKKVESARRMFICQQGIIGGGMKKT